MVFLRLTVKIYPTEQLPTSAEPIKPGVFLLPIEDPETLSLGGLASQIQERWSYLHPDLEPLEIKKIVDEAAENIELYPELTVADVWLDFGKARSDGLDQRGTVCVLQKHTPTAPERFPSVVQDWEAAMVASQRERDRRMRMINATNRVSPIQEGDEEEHKASHKSSWSDLPPRSQSKPHVKRQTPFPHEFGPEHRYPGVLASVETDGQELSHRPDRPTIAGTPSQRAESEELGDWAAQTGSQNAVERPSPSDGQMSSIIPSIEQIPSDLQSRSLASVPTASQSVPQPIPKQPSIFDLGDSTEESDPSSEDIADGNAATKLDTDSDDSSSDFEKSGQLCKSKRPSKQIGRNKAGILTDAQEPFSRRITRSTTSRKREHSPEEPVPVKEPRVGPVRPSTRQTTESNPESNTQNPNSKVVVFSYSSKGSTNCTSPQGTPRQIQPDSPVSTAEQLSPTKSPLSPSKPHAFCSPVVRAHWQDKEESKRFEKRLGLGLGITKSPPAKQPSQNLSQEPATKSPSFLSSITSVTSSKDRQLQQIPGAPSSATFEAKAIASPPQKIMSTSTTSGAIPPAEMPTFSSFDLTQATPFDSQIDVPSPANAHANTNGSYDNTAEIDEGIEFSGNLDLFDDNPKTTQQVEPSPGPKRAGAGLSRRQRLKAKRAKLADTGEKLKAVEPKPAATPKSAATIKSTATPESAPVPKPAATAKSTAESKSTVAANSGAVRKSLKDFVTEAKADEFAMESMPAPKPAPTSKPAATAKSTATPEAAPAQKPAPTPKPAATAKSTTHSKSTDSLISTGVRKSLKDFVAEAKAEKSAMESMPAPKPAPASNPANEWAGLLTPPLPAPVHKSLQDLYAEHAERLAREAREAREAEAKPTPAPAVIRSIYDLDSDDDSDDSI